MGIGDVAAGGDRVRELAAGLLALGLQQEQRVGIASARATSGSSPTSRSCAPEAPPPRSTPTTGGADTAYILGDSESRIVFAEDAEQLAKLQEFRDQLPELSKVVTFDASLADGDWVISLDDLAALGETYLGEHPGAIEDVAKQIQQDQLCTLIYTSAPPASRRACARCTAGGSSRAPPSRPRASSTRTTCSSSGCRWHTRLVRQGAALHAARLRFRHGDRRPRRQDHRQRRDREAHLHGCRAAHLREGLRPHRHDDGLPRAA